MLARKLFVAGRRLVGKFWLPKDLADLLGSQHERESGKPVVANQQMPVSVFLPPKRCLRRLRGTSLKTLMSENFHISPKVLTIVVGVGSVKQSA